METKKFFSVGICRADGETERFPESAETATKAAQQAVAKYQASVLVRLAGLNGAELARLSRRLEIRGVEANGSDGYVAHKDHKGPFGKEVK